MIFDNGDTGIPDGSDDDARRSAVVVASAVPLELRTDPVDHPSIPEDSVGLGTYVEGRLVGRQAMSESTVPTYRALLSVPRRLAYVAYDKKGSVEGQLAALVKPSEIRELGREAVSSDDQEDEPWKASVPSFDPQEAYAELDEAGGEPNDDEHVALLPLGFVVRMAQRRLHPDDLAAEAADVLRKVVNEGTVEIVDQFLDTI